MSITDTQYSTTKTDSGATVLIPVDLTAATPDLNDTERMVLLEMIQSSSGSDHAFGFTNEITCVASTRRGGYVSSLSKKGYMDMDAPHQVNDSDAVGQFTFTSKGMRAVIAADPTVAAWYL